MSASATYFVAATTVTSVPTRARTCGEALADRVRRLSTDHPLPPRSRPSRRCEKKSSGLQHVQRSTRSTDATPARRSARSAADQRSRRRRRSGPRRRAPTPRRRPRSSTARSRARRSQRVSPPTAATAALRRCPGSGRASRRGRPRGGALRRCGRSRSGRSRPRTTSIGSPGSSLQSPSPGAPRAPARFTLVACTCRLNESRSYRTPVSVRTRGVGSPRRAPRRHRCGLSG